MAGRSYCEQLDSCCYHADSRAPENAAFPLSRSRAPSVMVTEPNKPELKTSDIRKAVQRRSAFRPRLSVFKLVGVMDNKGTSPCLGHKPKGSSSGNLRGNQAC